MKSTLVVAAMLVCILPTTASAEFEELTNFVESFTTAGSRTKLWNWTALSPKLRGEPGGLVRYTAIQKWNDAMDPERVIDELIAVESEAAFQHAFGLITRLSGEQAFASTIEDFKLQVNWGLDANNPEFNGWELIITEIQRGLTRLDQMETEFPERARRGRILMGQLVAHLLPIYFVKAGNISAPIEQLRTLRSGGKRFVKNACGEIKDYGAILDRKVVSPDLDGRFDCGRSAAVMFRDGRPFVVLMFNVDADVPSEAAARQENRLRKLTGQ